MSTRNRTDITATATDLRTPTKEDICFTKPEYLEHMRQERLYAHMKERDDTPQAVVVAVQADPRVF